MFNLKLARPCLLAAFFLSTFGISQASAADRFVATTGVDTGDCSSSASPCLTLGYAVGQANATGDRILVAAGTYVFPAVTSINKELELRGAQADVDARTRSAAESILSGANGVLSMTVDNVIVNGFTIEGQTSGALNGGAVLFPVSVGGYQFVNNIVQNNIFGVYANSSGSAPSQLRFNLFQNNNNPGAASGNGIYADFGASDVLIESNQFSGNDNCGVTFDSFQVNNSDLTVQDNAFDQNGAGICLFATDGILIQNNQIENSTSSGVVLSANVSDALVQNNQFSGNVDQAIRIGSNASAGNQSAITIFSNQIVGNGGGVLLGSQGIQSGIEIHFNRIFDNTNFGLDNAAANAANAENNWWGCNAGPSDAACDSVSGPADFDPWLVLTLTADPSDLTSGQSSTLLAALTQNSAGQDTSSIGNVPDDTPVSFSSADGSVNPAASVTAAGESNSEFTPNGSAGVKEVCSSVDNQEVCVEVTVTSASPTPSPTPGFIGCLQGSGNLFGDTGNANCTGSACSLGRGKSKSAWSWLSLGALLFAGMALRSGMMRRRLIQGA